MVILGFPAEALPSHPECVSPQQLKTLKKKPFNHQSSNSPSSMTLKPQYHDHKTQPRKDKKIKKHCNHQEKEKPGTTVVYIRAYDQYATESSSDEGEGGEEEAVTKKIKGRQILHVAEVVWSMNSDHASSSMINHEKQEKDQSLGWKSVPELACKSPPPTEKDDQTFEDNGRRIRRKSNKVKIREKKNNDGYSSSSSSVKAADSAVKKELVLDCCTTCPSLGLCDVPGPIPDNLDSFIHDDSLALNFFEGLHDL